LRPRIAAYGPPTGRGGVSSGCAVSDGSGPCFASTAGARCASPCWPGRNPEVRAVSASIYDLLATTGFGVNPDSNKTGATGEKTFDVEDLASAFIRLSDGATLLVEASWAAHRRAGDEFGITLYGTEGGAELIVDDYEPVGSLRIFGDEGGSPVATQMTAKPGRGHVAVVEQFLE
jgi:predicted dehydrogenase